MDIYIYGTYIIYMYGICIYQDYIYIYMNYICTHLVVGELKTVMGWSVCVCVDTITNDSWEFFYLNREIHFKTIVFS